MIQLEGMCTIEDAIEFLIGGGQCARLVNEHVIDLPQLAQRGWLIHFNVGTLEFVHNLTFDHKLSDQFNEILHEEQVHGQELAIENNQIEEFHTILDIGIVVIHKV